MSWTIESIVDKIIEIEGEERKPNVDYEKDLKKRFKKAVSSTPCKDGTIKIIEGSTFDTDTDTFLNDLLEKEEVQTKIDVFFDQYKRPDSVGGQKGGSGECCYFLFLCFVLSIVFNNMATLNEQCNNGVDDACALHDLNLDTNINTFIFFQGEGGRKRKRTKKKKRRKKKKGTKKRR